MFRTVSVTSGERITVENGWLCVINGDGKEKKVPIDDIYSLVIDTSLYNFTNLSSSNTLDFTFDSIPKMNEFEVCLPSHKAAIV